MIRSFLKSERGTSVIEFAIIMPVLIFLVIGIIDVGRGMYFGIVAQNAARAGAAYGSQSLSTAEDGSGMSTAASTDGAGVTWSVTTACLLSVSGAPLVPCPSNLSSSITTTTVIYVKVQATGSFSTLIQYPGLPSTIPVTGTSIVRVVKQ
jgi:Flp pilus assembly protein TadG